MLIAFRIGELLIPPHQVELFGVLRPQPPVVRLAFQIKAVVAAIWALNFHTSFFTSRSSQKGLCFSPSFVRLSNLTESYSDKTLVGIHLHRQVLEG